MSSDGKILLRNKPVTVLVNGRKTQLADEDMKSYMENLTSENIRRIEIQEVSGSDQDASNDGGVINIVTKKIPAGFRTIAKAGYTFRKEHYDQYKSGLNLNAGGEKWNIYSDISSISIMYCLIPLAKCQSKPACLVYQVLYFLMQKVSL